MPIDQNEKRKRSQERLRELLTHPEQRGRVVNVSEIVHKLGTSKASFYRHIGNVVLAQEWLAVNQDAPVDAKLHYKNMLDEGLKKIESDVQVTVGNDGRGNGKKFFVPKQVAQIQAARAGDMLRSRNPSEKAEGERGSKRERLISGGNVTVREVTNETQVVEVSETDAIIQRIRDAYVMAPLGDMPNIREVMKGFGLMDSQGNSIGPVTEDQVRAAMAVEDWKNERATFLHKTMDLLPDEVKMVTMMRNLEMQKILYNEAKVVHRMNMQHYQSGQVKSLDGKQIIDYQPDSAQVAGLAEVMRRMVDGGTSINILINQFAERGDGGALVNKSGVSMVSRAYLSKLAGMSPDELEEESQRFVALSEMLATDEAKAASIDEIQQSNDVIDAQYSKPEEG